MQLQIARKLYLSATTREDHEDSQSYDVIYEHVRYAFLGIGVAGCNTLIR